MPYRLRSGIVLAARMGSVLRWARDGCPPGTSSRVRAGAAAPPASSGAAAPEREDSLPSADGASATGAGASPVSEAVPAEASLRSWAVPASGPVPASPANSASQASCSAGAALSRALPVAAAWVPLTMVSLASDGFSPCPSGVLPEGTPSVVGSWSWLATASSLIPILFEVTGVVGGPVSSFIDTTGHWSLNRRGSRRVRTAFPSEVPGPRPSGPRPRPHHVPAGHRGIRPRRHACPGLGCTPSRRRARAHRW